jgi:hypothetical protein
MQGGAIEAFAHRLDGRGEIDRGSDNRELEPRVAAHATVQDIAGVQPQAITD